MNKKCTLTDEELIDSCEKWVYNLDRTGGKAWRLRVPVDFNHDPDMLFIELGKRYKASLQDPPGARKWEMITSIFIQLILGSSIIVLVAKFMKYVWEWNPLTR